MKQQKPMKPVKAWTVTYDGEMCPVGMPSANGQVYRWEFPVFRTRKEAEGFSQEIHGPHAGVRRVEIREVQS